MNLNPEQIDEILGYSAFNNYTEVQKSDLRAQLNQSHLEYLQIAVFFSDGSIGGLIPDLVADSHENDASALALGKLIENINERINVDYGYPPTAIIGNLIGRLGPYDETIAREATDLIKDYAAICKARIISPSKENEQVFAVLTNDLVELPNVLSPLLTERQEDVTLTWHPALARQERQSLGRLASEQVTVLRSILANLSMEPTHSSAPLFDAIGEREAYLTVMRSLAVTNHGRLLWRLTANQSVIPITLPDLFLPSTELEEYLALMSSLAISNELSQLPRLTINPLMISISSSESSSNARPVTNQRHRFFPSPASSYPTQPESRVTENLAEMLAHAHELSFDEAIYNYNYILEQEPNNIPALLDRAGLYAFVGGQYTAAALIDYRRVLALDPTNEKALERIEQLGGGMSWTYTN